LKLDAGKLYMEVEVCWMIAQKQCTKIWKSNYHWTQ